MGQNASCWLNTGITGILLARRRRSRGAAARSPNRPGSRLLCPTPTVVPTPYRPKGLFVIRQMRGFIGDTGFPVKGLCCKTRRMSNSNIVTQKKRGRPASGQDPIMSVRLPSDCKEMIDKWRHLERDKPSRSEAIRWLVGRGLRAEDKERKRWPDRNLVPHPNE